MISFISSLFPPSFIFSLSFDFFSVFPSFVLVSTKSHFVCSKLCFSPSPLSSLSLSLCTLFLPLLFLAFVFGRGRLCRCRVFGEADCFLPLLRRITSSTWASWGCSEQLVSSSCSGRERPSESCCGPSSSPSRYSAGNRYTHNVRMVTIHVPALTNPPSSPLTGSAVCVPAHCHALLHLCHHRHAG